MSNDNVTGIDCTNCAKAKLAAWFMQQWINEHVGHYISCDPMQLEGRVWWQQLSSKTAIISFIILVAFCLVTAFIGPEETEKLRFLVTYGLFVLCLLAVSFIGNLAFMTSQEHIAMTLAWMKHFKHLSKTRAYLFLVQQMKVPKANRQPGFCRETQNKFEERLRAELADLAGRSRKGKPGSAGPCHKTSKEFRHKREAAEAFGIVARSTGTP